MYRYWGYWDIGDIATSTSYNRSVTPMYRYCVQKYVHRLVLCDKAKGRINFSWRTHPQNLFSSTYFHSLCIYRACKWCSSGSLCFKDRSVALVHAVKSNLRQTHLVLIWRIDNAWQWFLERKCDCDDEWKLIMKFYG